MQLLVRVIVDVHLGASLEFVDFSLDGLELVLGSLVVESWIYLILLVWVDPGVFIEERVNKFSDFVDLLLQVLTIPLQRRNFCLYFFLGRLQLIEFS